MSDFEATIPLQPETTKATSPTVRQVMLIVNGLDCPTQAAQSALEITAQSKGCLTVLYLTPPQRYKHWSTPVWAEQAHSEDGWQLFKNYFTTQATYYNLLPSQIVFEKSEFQKRTELQEMARQNKADLVILACHQWPCEMWWVS